MSDSETQHTRSTCIYSHPDSRETASCEQIDQHIHMGIVNIPKLQKLRCITYMEPQIRQKVGPGKFLMELKLTTFLIFRRRGSVIPTIHTLRQRGVSIFDIIKLVYLLFQPHVSSGTHLCHGCLPHMPRSTLTCAGCAEG